MNFNKCPSQNNLDLIVSALSGKRSPDLFLRVRNLQMGGYIGLGRELKTNPWLLVL